MKKNPFLTLVLALFAGLALTACDTSSDIEYDIPRDCFVSSVKLGTLNRIMHTTASTGADSTYTTKVSGSLYPMYIDQINNRIYNADSLPVGTDVSKVVFEQFSVSGGITINKLTENADTLFALSDSIDFRQARIVTVTSPEGLQKRKYMVEVRVHNEVADSCVWQKITQGTDNAIAPFVESRALCANGQLYIFGQLPDGKVRLVHTPTSAPAFDHSTETVTQSGSTLDVRSVQYFKKRFYALANGKVQTTEDPTGTWTENPAPYTFEALAGISSDSIYAISNGSFYASADGKNWQMSANDAQGMLPTANMASTFQPMSTDESYESLVLVGHRDGDLSVWKRNIDLTGEFSFPWMYLPQTEELGLVACPKLAHNNVITYDGYTQLAGVTPEGTLSAIYTSRDNGRTWKPNELKSPDMERLTTFCMTTDSEHYLWLIGSGSGIIYKGRINRLGWNDEPGSYDKTTPRH